MILIFISSNSQNIIAKTSYAILTSLRIIPLEFMENSVTALANVQISQYSAICQKPGYLHIKALSKQTLIKSLFK